MSNDNPKKEENKSFLLNGGNDYLEKMATLLAVKATTDQFIHEGPSLDNSTGKLQIKDSKIGIRGVFAGEDFKKGDAVEHCPTVVINHDIGMLPVLVDYIFPHEKFEFCLLPLGYAMMYNHADHPNCYWKYGKIEAADKGWITFFALHDIKKGTVLDGPAPRPLEIYPTTLKNGKIIVDLPNT